MRINNNTSTPNFGMALHMPSEEAMTKAMNKQLASSIYAVKDELKNLAKDVDIFISTRVPHGEDPYETRNIYIKVSPLKDDPKNKYYISDSVYNSFRVCCDSRFKFDWSNTPKNLIGAIEYCKSRLLENPSEIVNGERIYKPVSPSEMINPKLPPLDKYKNDEDKVLRYVIEHRTGNIEDVAKATNVMDVHDYSYRFGTGYCPSEPLMLRLTDGKSYCTHYRAANLAIERNMIKPEYQERFKNEIKILYSYLQYKTPKDLKDSKFN